MRISKYLVSGALTLGLVSAAWAVSQTTITVKDGAGSSQTVNTTPSVGAAGTPSTDVVTVQGCATCTASPLPTGASTSALQTTTNTKLDTLITNTGAAIPVTTSSGTTAVIGCDSTAVYDASTSGSTQLVALSSSKTIYVCGYTLLSAGTVNVKLITGTGAACVTGSANLTPAYELTAQVGLVDKSPFYSGLKSAVSSELCLNTSAGIAVQALVYYTQF